MPLLKLLAQEGARQGLVEDDIKSDVEVQFYEERVSKRYMFSGFLKDHNAQVDCHTEYAILRQAADKKLKYLAQLTAFHIGPNYISFNMERYRMNLREYLR